MHALRRVDARAWARQAGGQVDVGSLERDRLADALLGFGAAIGTR